MCGETGSDVLALTKELVIRQIEHRSGIHSNKSQHLAEGTEVASLRRVFFFILQNSLSFCMRHSLCRQGLALVGTQHLRPQGPVYVHAHCTEGVTMPEGRERANEDRNGKGGRYERTNARWEREQNRERGVCGRQVWYLPYQEISRAED